MMMMMMMMMIIIIIIIIALYSNITENLQNYTDLKEEHIEI